MVDNEVMVAVEAYNENGEIGILTIKESDVVDPRMLRESKLVLTGRAWKISNVAADNAREGGEGGYRRFAPHLRQAA